MKATSIIIHNFRSIIQAEINLDNYSLLVGTNNSGKSNIIDAIGECRLPLLTTLPPDSDRHVTNINIGLLYAQQLIKPDAAVCQHTDDRLVPHTLAQSIKYSTCSSVRLDSITFFILGGSTLVMGLSGT
jgi:hypothetical protein